jgi:hypothetical protein
VNVTSSVMRGFVSSTKAELTERAATADGVLPRLSP